MDDSNRYKLLKLLHENQELSQRDLARHMGVSLGKVNYCLKALIEKGLIKARNFSESENKRAYLYMLTRQGIEDKARVTVSFLHCKIEEYEQLKAEIETLREEVRNNGETEKPDVSHME